MLAAVAAWPAPAKQTTMTIPEPGKIDVNVDNTAAEIFAIFIEVPN
jgi:hypothetical protein